MKIVEYPHPVLTKPALKLEVIDDDVKYHIVQMQELVRNAKGYGLAAPQVDWPIRVFVLNKEAFNSSSENFPDVFINPEMISKKGRQKAVEGCLSVPGLFLHVNRAKEVKLRAFDLDNKVFEITAPDVAARIIQHEYDHLDGLLFTSKVVPSQRKKAKEYLKCMKRNHQHDKMSNV